MTTTLTPAEALRSYKAAQSCLDSIQEISDRLDTNPDDDELLDELRALALSQEVRSGWQSPGEDFAPTEYRLLLCWGGPAVQVIGELDDVGDPCSARLERQDWGEPWADVVLTEPEADMLLWFAQTFYWGN